tara:strand:- start:1486 stop:2022 length:537 start_codon:yes stop_codon:yes gene_type:complete
MNDLTHKIQFAPELQDQLQLLQNVLKKDSYLAPENRKLTAWATAIATQNMDLIELIKSETDELSIEEKKIITIASSRMAVTNPYFMSRNVFPLKSGGSLNDINLRPFQDLNIKNDTGYHYACIAISSVNSGFMCFASHANSLKSNLESEDAIDQALRIISAVLAIKQIIFNVNVEYLK